MAELRVLQFNNPRELIDKYCRIVGESSGKQMPHGVSFGQMIETIVAHEAASGTSATTTI